MKSQQNDKPYPQRLGRFNFFSRWEVAELPRLLLPGEDVLGVISGFYTGGTAILCVTSMRLLLVDKKFIRLSYEDIRYGSIKEVSYAHQAFLASVKFFYAGRELQFRSWYRRELRTMTQFVQHKIFAAHQDQIDSPSLDPPRGIREPAQDYLQLAPTPPVPVVPLLPQNPQLAQYLNNRIARWRRATQFIDAIPKVIAPPPQSDLQEHVFFSKH